MIVLVGLCVACKGCDPNPPPHPTPTPTPTPTAAAEKPTPSQSPTLIYPDGRPPVIAGVARLPPEVLKRLMRPHVEPVFQPGTVHRIPRPDGVIVERSRASYPRATAKEAE